MKDLFNNSPKIGDRVIIYSDNTYTQIGRILCVSEEGIKVDDDGTDLFIPAENNIVPVVVLGDNIIDKTI